METTDMEPERRPPGLFITATDTEVGKTWTTAAIARACVARGIRVGVYKPVASGVVEGRFEESDPYQLWAAAGKPMTVEQVCPQVFAAPLAPALAARAAGEEVDEALLLAGLEPWLDFDFVLVEGVGGLMSPVSDSLYVADLAASFGWPLVVVAPNQLGVINTTLQTLVTASVFRDGLDVAGILLNDVLNDVDRRGDLSVSTNAAELAQRCVPPLLAQVAHGDDAAIREIDWLELAQSGCA